MGLSVNDGEGTAASDAFEHLALAYWSPVYSYLLGKERSHEEGQDDTQGFFNRLECLYQDRWSN